MVELGLDGRADPDVVRGRRGDPGDDGGIPPSGVLGTGVCLEEVRHSESRPPLEFALVMAPEGRILDRARGLLEEAERPAEVLEGCWVGCRATRLADDDFELGVRGAHGISR